MELCGHYVNRAYYRNLITFIPFATLFVFSSLILDFVGQNSEVAQIVNDFLICYLPHLLFRSIFDIHRQQLNCYQLSHIPMIAQIVASALHVPIVLEMTVRMPTSPTCAIGIATSLSSFLNYVIVVILGYCNKDVRDSYVPFWRMTSSLRFN